MFHYRYPWLPKRKSYWNSNRADYLFLIRRCFPFLNMHFYPPDNLFFFFANKNFSKSPNWDSSTIFFFFFAQKTSLRKFSNSLYFSLFLSFLPKLHNPLISSLLLIIFSTAFFFFFTASTQHFKRVRFNFQPYHSFFSPAPLNFLPTPLRILTDSTHNSHWDHSIYQRSRSFIKINSLTFFSYSTHFYFSPLIFVLHPVTSFHCFFFFLDNFSFSLSLFFSSFLWISPSLFFCHFLIFSKSFFFDFDFFL